ncbi:hypothetical protein [Shewanella psychrotolerans]|uniref:hypothetical protein n=1 Tax=Shewanella psychrotolerans TaxID=2864206 RepID=UPI001C6579BD|nr:hypothetical protein [Shewanella psychrotolerans]QYK02146.1 hypothetical protein K0I62_03985 [Shewanella psychrotolerans]
MIKIFALVLAVTVLMFMFKHRFTRRKLRRSKKTVHQHDKIRHSPISEQPPIASEQELISTHEGKATPHSYHCVEIVNESGMCASAKGLKGKRYLSQEAPRLPLAGCENEECCCRYIHYEDRRKYNEDRRLDFGVTQELFGVFGEKNRRGSNRKGRRSSD